MRDVSDIISKRLFHPLWDVWDRSVRLRSLRELERTQWLSRDELRGAQWARLSDMLSYAHENCALYRRRFDGAGAHPSEIKTPEDFRKLPTLSKGDIREHTDEIISRLFNRNELFAAKTGGSTGVSLKIYFDKRCSELRNACAIRSDRWAGWDLGKKRAAIWGNPPVANTFKQRVRSALNERTIYLDTMNLTERSMAAFVGEWRRFRPSALFGHSHSIFMFAEYLLAAGVRDLRPEGIISSSMMLLGPERERIEEAFGCKVTDRYGCEEVSLIASECERHNGMHMNMDHVYVELIKADGSPAAPGEEGEIVVTDLINKGMPLIRYRIEDMSVATDRECGCGRGSELMGKVTGRTAAFLLKPDGGLVAGVSLVERTLTKITGLRQIQIVQEDISRLTLNVVRDPIFDQTGEDELVGEFRSVFTEEVDIEICYMDRLPQTRSGKYRFSISKLERPTWTADANEIEPSMGRDA